MTHLVQQTVHEPAAEFVAVTCSFCGVDDTVTLGFRDRLSAILRRLGLTLERLWVSGAGSHRYPPHRELQTFFQMERPVSKRIIMRAGQWLGCGELLVAYARKPLRATAGRRPTASAPA